MPTHDAMNIQRHRNIYNSCDIKSKKLNSSIRRRWKCGRLKISSNRAQSVGLVGECKYYFCACFSCYARLTNDPWYERRGDLFLLIPSPNYRTNFSRLSRGLAGAQEYRSPYANRSANKNFTATHLYLCLSCCTLKIYCPDDKLLSFFFFKSLLRKALKSLSNRLISFCILKILKSNPFSPQNPLHLCCFI